MCFDLECSTGSARPTRVGWFAVGILLTIKLKRGVKPKSALQLSLGSLFCRAPSSCGVMTFEERQRRSLCRRRCVSARYLALVHEREIATNSAASFTMCVMLPFFRQTQEAGESDTQKHSHARWRRIRHPEALARATGRWQQASACVMLLVGTGIISSRCRGWQRRSKDERTAAADKPLIRNKQTRCPTTEEA